MRILSILAAAMLGASPAACAPAEPAQSPLQYTENARRAYQEALDAYFEHDWEEAVQLFQEVKRKYGYSRYARLAELRIADASYHQEKYAEAIADYKGFVHDHPNDPEVVYARYKIAKSYFQQASGSVLLPPLEERDLAAVHDGYAATRALLADFPDYDHARELQYLREVLTGLLVRHELYVLRFYLERGNYQAAVARAHYALLNYEGSGLEPEATVLLGETYLRMKQRKKARRAFRSVLQRWPESPFVIRARNFLRGLGEPG